MGRFFQPIQLTLVNLGYTKVNQGSRPSRWGVRPFCVSSKRGSGDGAKPRYLRLGDLGRRRWPYGRSPSRRAERRAHPRRVDPAATGTAGTEVDAECHRRRRALALPARQPRVQRRPGHDQRRRVPQPQGRHARGDARDLGRFRRDRAPGVGDLRDPRPRRHLFAQQRLSGRGPGADAAHREWPRPAGAAVRAGDDNPRPWPDRRRRSQAGGLFGQADRGRGVRPLPRRALFAACPRPARL